MRRRRRTLLQRYLLWENAFTLAANRISVLPPLRWLFGMASRLGNWGGWAFLLLLMLAAQGRAAVLPIVWMLLTAAIGIGLYWSIKRLAARPRPSANCRGLRLSEPPLDRFSFPSGHTLHAVNFTLQILYFAPKLGWIVVPFALLVVASRLVLGLHYLSDVVVGAVLGVLLATFSLALQTGL